MRYIPNQEILTQRFATQRNFTLPRLFDGGFQGVVYDPSNIATLFQDSAGATPVTAPGDPVARVLDLSGNGHHATQTTSGARMTYGVVPKGGRRNLYLSSSASTSYIQLGSGTDGTLSYVSEDIPGVGICTVMQYAKLLSDGNRGPAIGITLPANRYITYSFFIRVLNGTPPAGIRNSSAVASGTGSLTSAFSGIPNGTWIRVDSSQFATTQWNTFSSTISNWWINSLTAGTTIQIGAIQCETHDIAVGQPATNYQRVGTTAFDITESGVQSCPYLQPDGVDDWLVTPNIDFSGTDKATMFAGVRKLSDAAFGIIAELTTNSDNLPGFFNAISTSNGDASRRTYAFGTRGTVERNLVAIGLHSAPDSAVLSSLHDNAAASGSQIIARRNGAVGNKLSDLTPTSAGNFSNAPLYIGSRAGTSFPLNAQIFGLAVVGKLASAEEIRLAQRELIKRTPQATLA